MSLPTVDLVSARLRAIAGNHMRALDHLRGERPVAQALVTGAR